MIAGSAVGCREIVFCVGHPTRWDEFDAAVYAGILRRTVIGQSRFQNVPATLVMAAESRAAFLYFKNNPEEPECAAHRHRLLHHRPDGLVRGRPQRPVQQRQQLPGRPGRRLSDPGVVPGAPAEEPRGWEAYEQLIAANPAMLQAAALSCRKAKEDVCSQSTCKSKNLFASFAPMRVHRDDINALTQSMPLRDVLSRYARLPDGVRQDRGRRSGVEQFEKFLTRSMREMSRQKLNITRIILTGSASRMPFVYAIVSRVFDKAQVLNDADPSCPISKGLALVAPPTRSPRTSGRS